ncbi:39 kDa FK506-binding nuclear protein [Drosophila grimshawi]|uniref:FK506-binding protein n=1 Tax=Drosophila grimshawi TaxID=7222 RepID=B4JS08_DROGR|nr:39 kDa FK506-binding nuclear protein [Drosophila grimshawi]EDV94548.1 GH21813 [Drosophila grimshawi]
MSMWWGLNMKPNRKYTQTIVQSFHLSGAALDEGESAKLYLTANQNKYILATLDTSKNIHQVPLDLNFCIGDKIAFQTTGNATVSLIGYMHDAEDEDYDDEEYKALAKELEKSQKTGGGKGAATNDSESEEGSEEEEDDSKLAAEYSSFLDEEESGDEEGEEDDDDEDEEDDDDDDDDDEDDSEAEDAAPQPKKAKLNENNKKPAKEQNGVAKKEDKQQQQQKSKKDKKGAAAPEIKKEQPKGKDTKQQQQSGGERAITGGVRVQDVSAGSGPEAKQGKRVSVYYIGRLKSNNKTFDSMQKGNGFKFALGAGEVIKGWDVGVVGMKVGGKRRITCPPHMAYGARGQPPTIPPNSTLVFDVELKAVH